MPKRSNAVVTLVGVGIIAVALVIVLTATLVPWLTAKQKLNKQLGALEKVSVTYLSVIDPLDRSQGLLPTDSEVRLTDVQTVEDYRARLIEALRGAGYTGKENAESGNWDLRIRFGTDGGTVDLYLRESEVYLAQNGTRWVFRVKNTEVYTALRGELIALLRRATAKRSAERNGYERVSARSRYRYLLLQGCGI